MKKENIAIIGGGAAGFFLAANLSNYSITIFEKANQALQKVKISGGGRCNVTNATFDPRDLAQNYPRGNKELLSVFNQFQPGDTMQWFEERNVSLKIEDDNRIFPVSDNAHNIAECLINEALKNGAEFKSGEGVKDIQLLENGEFLIQTNQSTYTFQKTVITTGSSPYFWKIIKKLGHKIVPPVPSLFTFKCADKRIQDLPGTTFPVAEIKIKNTTLEQSGPLLITHWGFSGPCVLLTSAWGARTLHNLNYRFSVQINFIGQRKEEVISELIQIKKENAAQKIEKKPLFNLTKRFWKKVLESAQINPQKTWTEISNKQLQKLASELTEATFEIEGKSTFKDEFVTAGGVDLKEIDFKTMQSKLIPNLYFSGEVLNIDAITGGFNFQACWSESFIISQNL